jgi:MoaA/NifB/PqqE/SkfB family radical SAM enzyme
LPYPKAIIIEPINVCQLKCPLCPTGLQKVAAEPVTMPLETFKTILAKVPFVSAIGLHRAGEPFLAPDILAMIKYAAGKKIFVVLSSNFSFVRPSEFFSGIVESGLGRLIVSLDGASRGSYEKYRIGGDFDLVVGNIKKLLAAKKRMNSKKPEIVWQFLVNRFNEHEIDTAKTMARESGVKLDLRPLDMSDNLVDIPMDTTIEWRKAFWLGNNLKYICEQYKGDFRYPIHKGICPELFTNLEITAEGKVLPCCGTWDKTSSFGDLMKQSFSDIWFGPQYVNSRRRCLNAPGELPSEKQTICFRCKIYGASPSLKDKLNLVRTILKKNLHHWQRRLLSFR